MSAGPTGCSRSGAQGSGRQPLFSLRTLSKRRILVFKAFVFALCLVPAVSTLVAGFTDRLGAEPIDRLTDVTGENALRLLVATLLVTPLRRLLGWNWLLQFRRMLGLFMFFYAFLHFSVYMVLDRGFDLSTVVEDVIERKYITAGFSAFVLLWPLALTSTSWAVRKLGAPRWLKLHKCVYAVAVLACVHFLWLVKGEDIGEPLVYSAIFGALFLFRYLHWLKSRPNPGSGKGAPQ